MMWHRFVKTYFSGPFVIIFCLGSFLLILCLLFEPTLSEFWKTFLHVVGIAFIAVALTAPISEFFQFQTLSEYMSILRGAQDSGIVHIFTSRLESRNSFQKAIEKEFEKAGKVILAGIAFPRIFHNPPLPEPIAEKMYNPNIPIKILLLNPKGTNADERRKIETGRLVIDDINRSIGGFQLILQARAENLQINLGSGNIKDDDIKRIKMEVHLYDFPPIAFMVMTDKCSFIEQYHFGRLPDQRPGECIGGRTSVLLFGSHATTHKIMEQHFEWIWKNKSCDITRLLLEKTKVEEVLNSISI